MSALASWERIALATLAPEVKGSLTPTPGTDYELWSVPSFATGAPEVVDGAQIRSAKRPVLPGDVLICKINPRINRVWKVGPRRELPQIASPEWITVRPGVTGRIDADYLRLYLSSPAFRDWISAEVSGVTGSHTRAKPSQVLAQPVPFPSPPEQRRIVEIIEAHLSHLDAADASLTLASLRATALLDAELDAAVWANAAPPVPVGSLLAEPMRNGRSDRATGSTSGTRTLTLTAVTKREFSDRFTKLTSTSAEIAENLWLRPGDILVQRSNTPDLVGTSALFDGPDRWAIFPDLLIRLRADESQILPAYLALALRSRRVHRTLRTQAKGLAGSMPKIDQATIGATTIPLPDIATQTAAVVAAGAAEDRAKRLTSALSQQQTRSRALRRAVLGAAFSGQLTGRSADAEVIEEIAES